MTILQLNKKPQSSNEINAKQMKSLVEGNSIFFVVQKGVVEAIENALLYKPPQEGSMCWSNNHNKLKLRLLYIVDRITISRLRKQKKDDFNITKEGFVNLKASYLKKVLGNDYSKYKDYLIENDIIESDKIYYHYPDNSKSLGYRFTDNFESLKQSYYIINDKQFKTQIRKSTIEKSSLHRQLFSKYSMLKIDYKKAKAILNKDLKDKKYSKVARDLSALRGLKYDKNRIWKVGQTERLYNPLSSIQKPYRDCIHIKGESLAGVDISNSIPLISILLFSKNNREYEYLLSKKILEYNKNGSSSNLVDFKIQPT